MKRILFVLICLLVAGLLFTGCGFPITEGNPLGIDPNEAQMWFEAGVATGSAIQAVGVATGNPAMIGYGVALAGISGWMSMFIIKKGKEDGKS